MRNYFIVIMLVFWATNMYSQFGPQEIISTNVIKPITLEIIDLDNDGFKDILIGSSEDYLLRLQKGLDTAGNFEAPVIINLNPTLYLLFDFFDVDNDGDTDIVFLRNNPREIMWLEHLDGAGTFGDEHIINNSSDGFALDFLSHDVNEDGYLDVIVNHTNTLSGRIFWQENIAGSGNFSQEYNLIQGSFFEFFKLQLQDMDYDGDLDILTSHESYDPSQIVWYENTGNQVFNTLHSVYEYQFVISDNTSVYDIQFADLNANGLNDIIVAAYNESTGASFKYLRGRDSYGNFHIPENFSNLDGGILLQDFDNDGLNDALSGYNNNIRWQKNLGDFAFGPSLSITRQVDLLTDIATSDLDENGFSDVISSSRGDNKIAWYPNSGILSIDDNNIKNIKAIPNPTNDIVRLISEEKIANVYVTDILVRQLENVYNQDQINLINAPTGIYIVAITFGNGRSENLKVYKR